jgi:AraC-like DNA-binding protein
MSYQPDKRKATLKITHEDLEMNHLMNSTISFSTIISTIDQFFENILYKKLIINSDIFEELIKKMTKELNINEQQLEQIVVLYSHENTLLQFLKKRKFEMVGRLILKSEQGEFIHRIKSLCYQSGYRNLSDFSHAFKRYMGNSPRQYRLKNIRENKEHNL